MIKNEKEYFETKKIIAEDLVVMDKQRIRMKKLGLKKSEIEKVMEPMVSFHDQLKDELDWFDEKGRGCI